MHKELWVMSHISSAFLVKSECNLQMRNLQMICGDFPHIDNYVDIMLVHAKAGVSIHLASSPIEFPWQPIFTYGIRTLILLYSLC